MYYVLCPGYDIKKNLFKKSSTERFIYKTRTIILDDGEGKHYADISCGRGDNITMAKRRGKYPGSGVMTPLDHRYYPQVGKRAKGGNRKGKKSIGVT